MTDTHSLKQCQSGISQFSEDRTHELSSVQTPVSRERDGEHLSTEQAQHTSDHDPSD